MTTERALVDLFHQALDAEDVAGPFQRLQLELEKSNGAVIRRRTRRTFMTRQRLTLLAAALAILMIASVLVGTRVYNNLHPTSQVPAGSAVSILLARPLQLKHFTTTDRCLDGPYTDGNYGTGPVFGVGGNVQTTPWGAYWNVGLDVPTDLSGPIVLRGQDVVKGWPMVIVGQYGTGSVYGHDVINGQSVAQYTAALIDTAKPPTARDSFNGGSYEQWRWLQGFKLGWSGCVGFQVDGPNFTEIFYSSGNSS